MSHQSGIDQLSRAQLARLARETMLAAQFNSRTGYAALRINHGDESYRDTAIDNWVAASPVYTRRMQQALGFAGEDDVAAIFKGLQLDCGFAHQYFDVHYAVSAPEEGRFWLASCGALLEAEPRGDEAVKVMCHDIEDPTFDATACATNPRARMRPLHRPPRVPAGRQPHCEWRVFIDAKAAPLEASVLSLQTADTQLAALPLAPITADEGGGLRDYSGPLFEQLQFERFSRSALRRICRELAIQHHLLVNSLQRVIATRYGEPAAVDVAGFQMQGSARVVSERLRSALAPELSGMDALQFILQLHPALQPAAYFESTLSREGDCLRLSLGAASPAMREAQTYGWCHLPREVYAAGLESLARGVDARAEVVAEAGDAGVFVFSLGSSVEEELPLSVQIARGAVLYQTTLEDHIPLLQAP